MDDKRIIELYFARKEDAIKETERKYGNYCFLIAHNILSSREDADGMPEFNESRYVLLKYDDGKLKLIADVPISDNDWDVRAIYRDGYLYAFSETKVVALHVDAE